MNMGRVLRVSSRRVKWVCSQCGLTVWIQASGGVKDDINVVHKCSIRSRGLGDTISGTGDHLHAILKKWFHADYTWSCGCESMVHQMNAWGPQRCREHINEIADKMVSEAQRRGWRLARLRMPTRTVAKGLVLLAIRRAERATTPATTPPPPTPST